MKYIIVLLSCSLFFISCNSKLSRSKAKELLTQRYGYPKSVTVRYYYGDVHYFGNNIDNSTIQARNFLKEKGLIEFNVIGIEQGFMPYIHCSLSFTEAGKPYCIGSGRDANGSYYDVKVAEEQLKDITGIIENKEQKSAYVDYTWNYGGFNVFTEAVEKEAGVRNYTQRGMQQERAVFVKYDDGWRVQ